MALSWTTFKQDVGYIGWFSSNPQGSFQTTSWWRSCGQASQVVSTCTTLQHHLHVCGWTRPVFWLVWMGGNGLLSPQCSYISSPYSPAAQMAPAQCSHFYSLHHSYNSAKCKCATHYEHHNSHRGFIKRKRVEVEEMLEALGPEQACLKQYVWSIESKLSWGQIFVYGF